MPGRGAGVQRWCSRAEVQSAPHQQTAPGETAVPRGLTVTDNSAISIQKQQLSRERCPGPRQTPRLGLPRSKRGVVLVPPENLSQWQGPFLPPAGKSEGREGWRSSTTS